MPGILVIGRASGSSTANMASNGMSRNVSTTVKGAPLSCTHTHTHRGVQRQFAEILLITCTKIQTTLSNITISLTVLEIHVHSDRDIKKALLYLGISAYGEIKPTHQDFKSVLEIWRFSNASELQIVRVVFGNIPVFPGAEEHLLYSQIKRVSEILHWINADTAIDSVG